jgi:hypothetical protein
MRDDLLEVLELYPEFSESFASNLAVTFSMRDDEVVGVDPSVFKGYYRTEDEEEGIDVEESDLNVGGYNRLAANNSSISTDKILGLCRLYQITIFFTYFHVCFHAYFRIS